MEVEVLKPEVLTLVSTSGLPETKSKQILDLFVPFINGMDAIEKDMAKVDKENPTDLDMKVARDIRLRLVKNRTAAEKVKTEGKASILVEGKLYDNMYGVIANTSKLLETQLADIEKFAENKEKERKAALKLEREELLKPFGIDTSFINLAEMPADQFQNLLESTEKAYNDRLAAEAKAEQELFEKQRAEAEERERVRLENERLKAEAEEREKLLAEERAKAEQAHREALAKLQEERVAAEKEAARVRAENEERLRKEREEAARIQAEKDEQARIEREAQEAKLKAEQEAKAKLEKEIADKKAKEEQEAKDKAAAERKAKNAPDKDKLLAYAKALKAVPKPVVAGDEAKNILASVEVLIDKIDVFIFEKTKEL